jgi:hypothetical protein
MINSGQKHTGIWTYIAERRAATKIKALATRGTCAMTLRDQHKQ